MRVLHALGRLFASYGLAVVLLVLLMILTFLGTLEQKHASIYDVQRKYFESAIVVHWLGPVPIVLPGAMVLLGLLFVNLIVGGLVRIRKRVATLGVIVGHVGILMLLGLQLELADDLLRAGHHLGARIAGSLGGVGGVRLGLARRRGAEARFLFLHEFSLPGIGPSEMGPGTGFSSG